MNHRLAVGSSVRLNHDDDFLLRECGAVRGSVGKVVAWSALGEDDDGVLVDWGSGNPVRANLDEVDPAGPIRERTLDTAKSLVSGQRAADYGDARESFERIAAIWTAILGIPVTAGQAALMLAGLKMARLAQTIDHEDSWVDLAGYAALGAEVSS